MNGKLQVLVEDSGSKRLVAGLPCSLRAAHRAAGDLKPASIAFRGGAPNFQARYARQITSLGPIRALETIDQNLPLLVLGPDGFPRVGALAKFVEAAERAGKASRWLQDGGAVAAYFPRAGGAPGLNAPGPFESFDAGGDWLPATSADTVRRAEGVLCAALAKDTDGYIAKLDRRVSIALSKFLLNFPVTPNDITTASLVLGLLGAWWLASGSQAWQFTGALLLWFCCILDGCDGEVARLKLLCSPSGAAYDLWADHFAHLATFVAIPFGVHRMYPHANFLVPGILLVTGFLGCGFSVWWLVLRKPEDARGPYGLLIERVASRDYVYLIVVLTALGRMDWFLWTAAYGSHAFWLGLWWLSRRSPTAA